MTPKELAARLPGPTTLHRISLAIAALDVVMSSDWEERWFSFDPTWDDGEEYASMANGSGDSYHIVFSDRGVVVRGFDHESDLSPWARDDQRVEPTILDGFPSALRSVIDEPAFNAPEADDDDVPGSDLDDGPVELTFCFWCVAPDDEWCAGSVADDGGAAELLAVVLDGTPEGYRSFAADYYEVELGDAVDAVFGHEPMTAAMIHALNPEADVRDVLAELEEIGYPTA
jgi:hypothetical protein